MFNIATINIQNKYLEKNYNGLYKGTDNTKLLLGLIDKYNLNILGIQEVTMPYLERFKTNNKNRFKILGEFRYPKNFITTKLGLIKKYNESTPIITKEEVISHDTKWLPWLKSYVPRIVTIAKIKTKDFGNITFLNTHIDNLKQQTKKEQLNRLFELIEKENGPIILTGDFNMTIKNKDFKEFINKLKKLNISLVDINCHTFKASTTNRAIDHIFISSKFKVESIIIEKDNKYKNFSDHYPVIVKLNKNLGFTEK